MVLSVTELESIIEREIANKAKSRVCIEFNDNQLPIQVSDAYVDKDGDLVIKL